MGASGSKAVQNGVRKFPARAAGSAPAASATRTTRPVQRAPAQDVHAENTPPEHDGSESMTADFSERLRKMGVVQPNPTFSPSSTAAAFLPLADNELAVDHQSGAPPASRTPPAPYNATLGVLEARRRLQAQADAELEAMGQSGFRGREFVGIGVIRDALALKRRGVADADIEARLRLRPGLMGTLEGKRTISLFEDDYDLQR